MTDSRSFHVKGFLISSLASRSSRCLTLRLILCAVLAPISIAVCQKAPPAPVADPGSQAKPELAQDRGLISEQQSCRAFVQKFYDWYWNQFADKANDLNFDLHKLHWYDDALRLKPPVLSPELIRLIKKDEDESKAAGGDIVNLDFDPFLNSQDAQGKYVVGRVVIARDRCRATLAAGHMDAELQKSGSIWLFVNFHYSYYSEDGKKKEFPNDDLLHILSR